MYIISGLIEIGERISFMKSDYLTEFSEVGTLFQGLFTAESTLGGEKPWERG